MSIPLALVSVVAGVVLVVTFAGRLVRGAVGTSSAMGVSAFLISVIFIGFDPENLAVGVAGSVEQVPGIALGSVVGAAMVALALAFGVTALLAPMRFASAPTPVLAVPVAAVALFGVVSLDGRLSRLDGAVLLLGYALAVAFLIWLSRRGVDVASASEPEEPEVRSVGRAAGLLVVSLVAIVVGSELAVEGSKTVIAWLGVADTFYGMAILALLAPMRFASAPTPVLAVPVAAVALFAVVSLDGRLSRLDGAVLLLGYALAVAFLVWLSRRGVDVASATEPDEP